MDLDIGSGSEHVSFEAKGFHGLRITPGIQC